MTNKHTRGPWHVVECEHSPDIMTRWIEVHDAAIGDVAHVTGGCLAQAKDNARLIATAPDLLAYKDYVEDNLERIERGGWTPVCFDEFVRKRKSVERIYVCNACGGMGHTIGFEGPKKIKYPCESCEGGQS